MIRYLSLLRPKQWIKNLFVFAPLVFSKHFFEPSSFLHACGAFIVFTLAAGSVYIINDILDATTDKLHPKKMKRGIASGKVSVTGASLFAAITFSLAIIIAMSLPWKFQLAIVLYVVLNLWYSLGAKHIVILDIFIVAAGFMLRIVSGAYAIEVEASAWLILCTLFLSLFLGIAKRRGELIRVNETDAIGRPVLEEYSVEFIDHMLTVVAAGIIISYALYTVSERTITLFGTDKMIYTTVFVLYGVFRYFYLIHKKNLGESPTDIVTTDIPLIVNAGLWMLASGVIIYFL